jgi:hypothetical protein
MHVFIVLSILAALLDSFFLAYSGDISGGKYDDSNNQTIASIEEVLLTCAVETASLNKAINKISVTVMYTEGS